MNSYSPENVFAVCTYHSGYGYKNFLTNTDLRKNITIYYKSQNKPLLVIQDKKLNNDFSCKTGWSSEAVTIAFGAGVITGLAVAAS